MYAPFRLDARACVIVTMPRLRFRPREPPGAGLNFLNDDVIDFFSPHATGKAAIFQFAIGKAMKRKPQ